MSISTFFVQPESSNKYMTWDASYDLSQASVGSPGTNQKWDFEYNGNYVSLGNPKSNSGDVFTYLKYDGTNLFQNSCCDNACVWNIEPNMSYTWYTLYNVQNGNYLGVNTSTFQLEMFSSSGTNTQWMYGTEVEWGSYIVNPLYVTISSTNYYLVTDLDGYTVTTSTSLYAPNPCFEWWINDTVGCSSLAPYYESEYINSNGDGTVSINGTQEYWTAIPLASDYSVAAIQSVNNGFLQFNSDGSTIGEYITTPTPYPGALGTECQLRLTGTFLNRNRLGNQARVKRLKEAKERARQMESKKVVTETPKAEIKETPKTEEFVGGKSASMGSDFLDKLNKLESVGFTNRTKNIEVLIQTRADIKSAIEILVDSNPRS